MISQLRTRCGEYTPRQSQTRRPVDVNGAPSSPTSLSAGQSISHLHESSSVPLAPLPHQFITRQTPVHSSPATSAAMSSGGSPPLSSLVLGDDDGASPWGDEIQQRSTATPPITLPEEDGFKDSGDGIVPRSLGTVAVS